MFVRSRRDQLMKPEFKNHNILTTISPRDRHDVRSLCELTRCADNDPSFPHTPRDLSYFRSCPRNFTSGRWQLSTAYLIEFALCFICSAFFFVQPTVGTTQDQVQMCVLVGTGNLDALATDFISIFLSRPSG
jgi:hypothetical protein